MLVSLVIRLPTQQTETKYFSFKKGTLLVAWMACGSAHWGTIENKCVTTKGAKVKPAPPKTTNPFIVPKGPVFTSKVKKYVKCRLVTIAASQVAWGLKQCQGKALSSQEQNSVVYLCNATQEAAFAGHCQPPGYTSVVHKYENCKPVAIDPSQVSWGKEVCLNKSLASQEPKSIVYLCNPSQEAAYAKYCAPPPKPVVTPAKPVPVVTPVKPPPKPVLPSTLSTLSVISTSGPQAQLAVFTTLSTLSVMSTKTNNGF